MNSNKTQSHEGGLPGDPSAVAGGERSGSPARRRVLRMVLVAGVLAVGVALFVVATRSSPPATSSEAAQDEATVREEKPADALPTANASEVGKMPPLSGPLVDSRGQMASVAPESPLSIPEHWGIEITKLGVAAGGKALDMRYKVLDVAKATSLLYLTNYVYVFNHANQKVLIVPFQRENQTSQKLVAGKTYFTLLPNKEERVTSGSTVTVVVGGSRAENLLVN